MSIKPILFNTEMVRAILDGRKTVTRRVVRPQPNGTFDQHWGGFYKDNEWILLKEPCRPGDVLWVRETFFKFPAGGYAYKADASSNSEKLRVEFGYKWRPSIHMPREAARIFLRVKYVRVERLQEITMQDIRREGSVSSCAMCSFNEAKSAHGIKCRKAIERSADCALENQFPDCGFRGLWDSTVRNVDRDRYGWAANPWVWRIQFERCEKPEEG